MAQDGDFRFQGNVWSGYDNGTWQILPDEAQESLELGQVRYYFKEAQIRQCLQHKHMQG